MLEQSIEQSVKEKIDFWNQHGRTSRIHFTLAEYKFYLNNYKNNGNDRFNYIVLNLSQKDLDNNTIETILLDAKRIVQIGFEFENITNIDFQKLRDLLSELKKNNSFSDGLEYIKFASSTVKEKDIETVEREAKIFNEIISEVTEDMSDFEKFTTIYRSLGKRISYDFENRGGFHLLNEYLPQSNLEGVIKGKSICGGYSLILKQALELVGIKTKCRVGGCPSDEGVHAWNQVNLDGVWYNTDLTFDAERIVEEELPNCLKSDDTFQRMGYVDTGNLFIIGEDKEKCPSDFSLKKLNEVFKDYTIEHYDFSKDINITIKNINGQYDIFIRNMEDNKIQYMRITSPEQLYNLLDVALDGRKLKLTEDNQLRSRNVIVNMDIFDIKDYLQIDGLYLEDFIKESALNRAKQLQQVNDSVEIQSLVSSGVEAGIEANITTEQINESTETIIEQEQINQLLEELSDCIEFLNPNQMNDRIFLEILKRHREEYNNPYNAVIQADLYYKKNKEKKDSYVKVIDETESINK